MSSTNPAKISSLDYKILISDYIFDTIFEAKVWYLSLWFQIYLMLICITQILSLM